MKNNLQNIFRHGPTGVWKHGKLVFALFFIACVGLSATLAPTDNVLTFVLVSVSIAFGILLYVGGLVMSVFAFKQAHALVQKQHREWHGSLTS